MSRHCYDSLLKKSDLGTIFSVLFLALEPLSPPGSRSDAPSKPALLGWVRRVQVDLQRWEWWHICEFPLCFPSVASSGTAFGQFIPGQDSGLGLGWVSQGSVWVLGATLCVPSLLPPPCWLRAWGLPGVRVCSPRSDCPSRFLPWLGVSSSAALQQLLPPLSGTGTRPYKEPWGAGALHGTASSAGTPGGCLSNQLLLDLLIPCLGAV